MENKVWFKIDSTNLQYGGEWEDSKLTIRAKIFGVMVGLAKDRIDYYRSDLYHDALWINENVVGPMQFDWIARESGTYIGEVVLHIKDDDWSNAVRYRFDFRVEDRKYVLDTYQSIPLTDVPNEPYCNHDAPAIYNGVCECGYEVLCNGYLDGGGSLQHDGDTCPQHEIDTETEYALPAEFHPYFSNEPLPESVVEAVANQDMNPMNATIDLLFGGSVLGKATDPTNPEFWTNEHVTVQEFPTLRNESTPEPGAPKRKENKMESIIRELREKYEEASNSKDQLEEYQSNINDAVDELDTYMSDLDSLIDSLDSLPEVSVYVDLDTVSFDS